MLAFVLPLAVLILWIILGVQGKLNQALIPKLSTVFTTGKALLDKGTLTEDTGVSLVRALRGYAVGALIGIVLGTLMGLNKAIHSLLNSLVTILRAIPMMALMPLFILWFGIGETCKTVLVAVGTMWAVMLNTIQGIHSVDPNIIEVANVLEKGRGEVLLKVILPAALPSMITGLRLGLGTAWACVVSAEMLASSSGLGYMIMFARQLSQPDKLYVGIFIIGIVGLATDKILLFLQKKLIWWTE
jgi:sulfonate transport system permease protein